MTDRPTPAEMEMSPRRRAPWRNLSPIWLVPLAALVIALAITWKSYSERGVLIQIAFENAAGVTAGETSLRYRDVTIGVVESVHFTSGLEKVLVSVRVDKDVAPYINDTAQFWVVRPEVSAEGVTGLTTVLSGVYIEGIWEPNDSPPETVFEGLAQRPLVDVREKGTRITLQAIEGTSLAAGSPVFYRGVKVGRTEAPRLDANGTSVIIDAFIEAPHDKLLTTATRFWDASGFNVSFGPAGLKLDVGSIAALVSGGVSFNTFFSGGGPMEPGQVYELYPDEDEARTNAFSRVSERAVNVSTIFDQGVSGLTAGAALNYKGLKIGEVGTLSAFVSEASGKPVVQQLVTLSIDPGLLGLPDGAGEKEVLDFLQSAVESGVRARLTKASLLTSSLVVELAEMPDAPPAELDRDAKPYPILPNVPSDLPDINATMEGVMKRVNNLKIEELIQQATTMMGSIQALATDASTRAAPKAVVGLIDDARALVNDDELRALPGELKATIAELRTTVTALNEQRIADRLAEALDYASEAATTLTSASEGVPELVEDLKAVAGKARDLKAEELVAAATDLLNSADALIGTDAARALPAALNGALDEVRTILGQLREGGAVDNANAALASAQSAAESLEMATADLPQLAQRLDSLIARSEQLIAAYGDRSDFNRETLGVLRELRDAARSVSTLMRQLERNPNSIFFGK